jgi:hypothetical protein
VLHEARDGCHASRARELVELGELAVDVGSVGKDGEDEPPLRRRAGRGVRLMVRHVRDYAAPPAESGRDLVPEPRGFLTA